MNKTKNIVIIVLGVVFIAVVAFGLKTWDNEGQQLSSQNEKELTAAYKSEPIIRVTSDNLFTSENVTASPVVLSFIATGIKDTYINGQSLEKATEAMVDQAGVYEAIIESEGGLKAILKFTIDPNLQIETGSAIKGDEIRSEMYTGEIKPPVIAPVVKALSPDTLTNGGSVSAEEIIIEYSSPEGISSVVLDDEEMEVTGTVTSYMPGQHRLVVTDNKGQSTVYTFTNTYDE